MRRMGGVAIVVFCDLVDSTALLAALGDDRMEGLRRTHMTDVASAVEGAGGRVVKTLGDGTMASFESALGALRAAAGIQEAVERLDDAHSGIGIAARVGVAAGEPIADGDDLHGMTVVIASRLSSAAASGEVLVQDLVRGLVESRDGVRMDAAREYDLKGVPASVWASSLLWRELAAAEEPLAAAAQGTPEPDGTPVAPSVRLPAVLGAYMEEPLIGRDREIEALREATAPRERRRAVVVLGEPGIGKTRHAAAAAAEAHARGAMVVLARCPPEAVVPFEPWVRAIGELARAGEEEWCRTLAKQAGPELASLVPELGPHADLAGQGAADRMAAAEGARYRLLCGIGAVLECAADGAPLHVVLDDAHWCDPASAQALAHLLDSAQFPLVLVVTARDREMGRRHPVSRVLAGLRRTDDLVELRLAGLDASGMAALVDARVGRSITPGLADRLLARTAGNPFFAGELARDLDGRGALADGQELDSAPVPDAVADLVEERLARLDPDTERFLAAVAAIGPTAPVALAARAIGFDDGKATDAVGEALSERLVDDVPAAQPTIAFPHALVREALIAGTGEADRARLHLAIAEALEGEPEAEPAELARHFGLAVELTGPQSAIAAYRAAAAAAADGHDHEQAAAHMQSVLALQPEDGSAARAASLLELGEQELLSADLVRARESFRGAIEAARATGDAVTFARAALGFAGGDIGFGFEVGTDDPVAVDQLREGLEMLGEREPRLALRMIFRLAYLLVYTDGGGFAALERRAGELAERLGDPEARLLGRFTALVLRFSRGPSLPPDAGWFLKEGGSLLGLAEECDREDLLFRVVLLSAAGHYRMGRIRECEEAVERGGEIAQRLASPRFTWEVDLYRSMRMTDRGDREAAGVLRRRAGAVIRRLRPDMHVAMELFVEMLEEWYFDGEFAATREVYEALDEATPRGFLSAAVAIAAASGEDVEMARRRMWALLGDGEDLEALRRPDGHMPLAAGLLAFTATVIGDREAGARLRPLFEPLRSTMIAASPALCFGMLPEWHIGRLEILAGRPDAAVGELRPALERADEMGAVWPIACMRVDLAIALHRRGGPTDAVEANAVLAEAEELAERHGVRWADRLVAEARAEIEGRPPPPAEEVGDERSRRLRALASRGGRRALTAMVQGLDDAEIERRFAEPRRQRTLVRAMARGFQPAKAAGFSGAIAYELEPFAIEPPPGAPWRWAIEVDSDRGRARLLEPAPLDAAVTVHFGLADWVQIAAGLQDPFTSIVAGRCSVEGDVRLAIRLEAMFGGS
jgi:class 3 adenylate cyclase/tetratricopeptide (TPR) repeat protein